MSGVYKDCSNCEIRKGMAERFDLPWFGAADCPFTCPFDEEKAKKHTKKGAKA